MNNKQVPEDIITDAFQISEDLKNGNIHNNRQFVQLSHVKELVASLPAEPSTPETKDKPATGSGGGLDAIVKELTDIRNKLYNELPTGEVNAWDLIQTIKWHCNDLDTFINKLATLRQPTGTVYVRVAEKTDWVLGYYYRDAENKEMLMGECFLKPIQFVPEREGADVGFYCSDAADTGNEDLRCINQCPKCKTFLKSTGEGINE